jgi:plasmid maintenance system antidote protein VapI
MPVILATQEAEIRRIVVPSQPGEIVHETLSQKNPSQKGLVEWLKGRP